MLTAIHFLTTYACNFECEHCFLHCSPRSRGTFSISQIRRVLDECGLTGTIEKVFFEGGEPMLYYPLVLAGTREACRRGLKVGIVTNGYWATSVEDAALWLRPLAEGGLTTLGVSDDGLHYGEHEGAHADRALAAARELDVDAKAMCTQRPTVDTDDAGRTTIVGGVMFRGRAAETLGDGLPLRPTAELTSCPHENLADPSRVHVDCFGHVHLCQGLSMGNMWATPLSQLVAEYDPQTHPIVGPLLAGGPVRLAEMYGVALEAGYLDECHLCYAVRKALIDRFGEYLAPRQVYGLEPDKA